MKIIDRFEKVGFDARFRLDEHFYCDAVNMKETTSMDMLWVFD